MTEDEAKQKKCPLLFMFHVRSIQDEVRPTVEYFCVGSACMMFRVTHGGQPQEKSCYCGLAGKP